MKNRTRHPLSDAIQKSLSDAIRKQRDRVGLTQIGLSKLAHVHYTFVGHVERGFKTPGMGSFVRLAMALGVKPSTLLRRAGL